MRKHELLDFIDKVERKAVNSVEDRYKQVINDEKLRVLESKGYMERINKIQHDLNLLFDKAQSLVLDMTENVEVKYKDYCNLASEISTFTGEGLLNRVLQKSSFEGGSVQKIINKKYKEIQEVKDNYAKVRAVCQRLENGKKVAEYLKGLGFDLSSLEAKENKALVADIDKSKLFVCGDNK